MDKISNIKRLYAQIDRKTEFIEMLAEDTDRSKKTIRTHWFASSSWWAVPEEFQDRVIELLQKTIANQNLKQEV